MICIKNGGPPPTESLGGRRDLKFGLYNPHGDWFYGIEAIFEFLPRGWDMGVGAGTLGGPKMAEFFFLFFQFFSMEPIILTCFAIEKTNFAQKILILR